MRIRLGAALALPAVLLVACGSEGDLPADAEITIRVEDGVTIVENPGLEYADSTAWVMDSIPIATIGQLEGPPEYLFGRIGGFLVLPGGEILIADGQASELRMFDPEGQFLRKFGREGEGPGEFQGISQLRMLAGDSLAVLERGGQQIHVLDPDFGFVRRFRLFLSEQSVEPPMTSDMLEGVFGSGAPLMGDYIRVCGRGAGEVCADSARFFRTDEEGGILGRLGRHAYTRGVSTVAEGTNVSWSWPHPQPLWTVAGDRFYYLDTESEEIEVYDSDGELQLRISVRGGPPEWGVDEVFPEREVPDDPQMADMIRAVHEAQRTSPLPERFAQWADMVVDESGWIWMREYLPANPRSPRAPRWYVFDPEGRLQHSIASPPGLVQSWRAFSLRPGPYIGDDVALGLVRDELGVESVVAYRLRKNQ